MNIRIVCLASVMLGLLLPPSVHAQSLSLEDLEREGRLLAGFDLVAQSHVTEAMPIFTAVLGSGDASQAARALAGIGEGGGDALAASAVFWTAAMRSYTIVSYDSGGSSALLP